METTQVNQQTLFTALASIVLPQLVQSLVAKQEALLAVVEPLGVSHVATLPDLFPQNGDWKFIGGSGSYDWALMPIQNDPLYHHPDGFPMPQPIIKRLQKLRKVGVEFDDLWIAHEVKGIQAGQTLRVSDLLPAPKPQKEGWASVLLGCLFSRLVQDILTVRDPILFGVKYSVQQDGRIAQLYLLGAWAYGA